MRTLGERYKDLIGNELHVGDVIVHPDGSKAKVVFDDAWENPWRAVYENGDNLWLAHQIGGKGSAVLGVMGPRPAAEPGYDLHKHLPEGWLLVGPGVIKWPLGGPKPNKKQMRTAERLGTLLLEKE